MIASDLDNPEFVGATNPDSLLHVVFYRKPLQNEFKTEQEKRPIFEDVDFVRITIPGDKNNVIDTPVREEHKRRFPRHWDFFQKTHGTETLEIGTPLSQWPLLTPAQVEELKALKFTTVESIAGASDLMLGKIGMGGSGLRDKAIRFLTVAKDSSAFDHAKEELDKIKAEQAEKDAKHAAELQALKDQMQQLMAAMQNPTEPPKRRGRPPKVKEQHDNDA